MSEVERSDEPQVAIRREPERHWIDSLLVDRPPDFDVESSVRIGDILVKLGLLKSEQISRIVRTQVERRCRFGEAALTLRYVSAEAVHHALAVQFNYGCLPPGDRSLSETLAVAHQPFGLYAEAVRSLRTQLLLKNARTEPLVAAVASPGSGDGRSELAANLAISFAQAGKRTLLVDADLRAPRMHALFRLHNNSGLGTLLSGRQAAHALQQVPFFATLQVIVAGPAPPNPQELLAGGLLPALIEKARCEYDVVLIDTSSADVSADWEWVVGAAGRAIVVAKQHQTSQRGVAKLLERMGRLGAEVAGGALLT